jgi:RimJ/RimL family protein N-acetyltransferase
MTMTSGHSTSTTSSGFERRLHDVHFRLIRPDDLHRLQRFHRRLSPETVQYRFHGAKRELSIPLAHRFTDIDGHNDAAIVATTGTRGRIIGVARYNRIDATSAEVAFVVEDAYQHHGIGRRLLFRLRDHAVENGITEFVAEILTCNTPMFKLLHELGEARTSYRAGVCEARISLIAP